MKRSEAIQKIAESLMGLTEEPEKLAEYALSSMESLGMLPPETIMLDDNGYLDSFNKWNLEEPE